LILLAKWTTPGIFRARIRPRATNPPI